MREWLLNGLSRRCLDGNDFKIIHSFDWNQSTIVRKDVNDAKPFEIKRGVRQGCNVYSRDVFAGGLDKVNKNVGQ